MTTKLYLAPGDTLTSTEDDNKTKNTEPSSGERKQYKTNPNTRPQAKTSQPESGAVSDGQTTFMAVTFRDNNIDKLLLDLAPEGFGHMREVDAFIKQYKGKVVVIYVWSIQGEEQIITSTYVPNMMVANLVFLSPFDNQISNFI